MMFSESYRTVAQVSYPLPVMITKQFSRLTGLFGEHEICYCIMESVTRMTPV